MIKLKDLLKEDKIELGKVYTYKDKPPFKTNKQIKLEEKISVKSGKYLDMDGSVTSIPGPYDRDAVVFDNNRGETAKVYKDNKGLYLDTNRYDKRFKDLKKLADWLNKNKFRYVGIDDR